jgi:hypothetical protein
MSRILRMWVGGGLTSRLGTTELHGKDELIVFLCFERVGFFEQGVGMDWVFFGLAFQCRDVCIHVQVRNRSYWVAKEGSHLFVNMRYCFCCKSRLSSLIRSARNGRSCGTDERRSTAITLYLSSSVIPYMDMYSSHVHMQPSVMSRDLRALYTDPNPNPVLGC